MVQALSLSLINSLNMKTEKSIVILTSLSLLAFAFNSYPTPPLDRNAETEYLIDIETYKRAVTDRISLDNKRMKELNARLTIRQDQDVQNDEYELAMLKEKINGMKTTLNNYDENGLELWELFKEEFENDLTAQHESLINLIIKKSNTLNDDDSIRNFIK